MALPTSGSISLSQVNVELGKAGTTSISLGNSDVRGLAGLASGTIAMSNLHGKSAVSPPVIKYTGNNGDTNYEYRVYVSVTPSTVTTSASWVSGGSYLKITKINNTTFAINNTRNEYKAYNGTLRVSGSNTAGTGYVDIAIPYISNGWYIDNASLSCFTGDSLVTMADGSLRRIDEIPVGALVKTAVGTARVTQIDMPVLGRRPLVVMADGKCKTSAEHSFWTRNPAGEQWWATRDIEQWRKEALSGDGPSFGGHEPFDLTGQDGLLWDFATEDGWKTTTWFTEPADPSTQLYHLLLDQGGSYFVDGYLISSIADTGGVDWENFSWK